jgi:hypothetical protein
VDPSARVDEFPSGFKVGGIPAAVGDQTSVEGLTDPRALIEIDHEAFLLRMISEPLEMVLFITEERNPQSHAVEHMGLGAVIRSR